MVRKEPATYRQGDVLLVEQSIPRSWLPARLSKVARDAGRLVLAYGEVTGHAHVIDAPESEAVQLSDKDNQRFLRLMSDANLVHEEHDTISVPKGTYRVIQQEQYVPAPTPRNFGRSLLVGD
jgi:hypothetical protein